MSVYWNKKANTWPFDEWLVLYFPRSVVTLWRRDTIFIFSVIEFENFIEERLKAKNFAFKVHN